MKLVPHVSLLILYFLKKGNESIIYKQNKYGQTELKNNLLYCFDSVKMLKK